jgi:hypothetical protein
MFTFHSDPYHRIPVFLSGNAPRVVLWVGSQGESFFSLGYLPQLIQELAHDWSVAQVLPSSSLMAHGGQDHVHDAEDLDDLLKIFVSEHGMNEVCLFGCGTGVQLVLELLENGRNVECVTRVLLQGIVMDPNNEIFSRVGSLHRAEAAKSLCAEGRRDDVDAMKSHYDMPTTPARVAAGGYLTVQEALWTPALIGDLPTLQQVMGLLRVPTLIMLAMQSSYAVAHDARQRFERAVQEQAVTREVFISYFNDTSDERRRMLKTAEAQHTAAVVFFLKEQDEKRRVREEASLIQMQEEDRRNNSVLAKSRFAIGVPM